MAYLGSQIEQLFENCHFANLLNVRIFFSGLAAAAVRNCTILCQSLWGADGRLNSCSFPVPIQSNMEYFFTFHFRHCHCHAVYFQLGPLVLGERLLLPGEL